MLDAYVATTNWIMVCGFVVICVQGVLILVLGRKLMTMYHDAGIMHQYIEAADEYMNRYENYLRDLEEELPGEHVEGKPN